MSPAEHYLEAERLLNDAADMRKRFGVNASTIDLVAEAQVHALLATTARAFSATDPTWED